VLQVTSPDEANVTDAA